MFEDIAMQLDYVVIEDAKIGFPNHETFFSLIHKKVKFLQTLPGFLLTK